MTAPVKFAVFVSGRGSNLKALLDARAAGALGRVEFVAAIGDKPSLPAFDHALAAGVPTHGFRPKSFANKRAYEEAVIAGLEDAGAEWIALAGYMRMIGPALLEAFGDRIVNIHPSLLPSFPGLHAQRQAIEHGVKISGCTVHFVDSGMDTGPIILQKAVPCLPGDDEDALSARILEQEHKAYPEALDLISKGLVRREGRRVYIDSAEC